MKEPKTRCQQIERSIIKNYRKEIWRPFVDALNEYKMIEEGDNIAVCISGGKDSMLLAKCMQEILRHGKMKFGLHFLVMDPGYHPANRKLIEENAALMEIPIEIFESDIFDVVVDVDESPCYLCARMRRGFLYAHAKELGCNKIALGHHLMPKLHSTNFEGMELLRPLYFVKERAIIDWKEENGLQFLQCACRFTEAIAKERAMRAESAADGMAGGDIVHSSKRQEMKELIEEFRKINPNIENNIFKSVSNVNLDACIGYVKNGKRHHFLEEYESDGDLAVLCHTEQE